MYQSMRSLTQQVFRLLRGPGRSIPQTVQVLDLEEEILSRFHRVLEQRIDAKRIFLEHDRVLAIRRHAGAGVLCRSVRALDGHE